LRNLANQARWYLHIHSREPLRPRRRPQAGNVDVAGNLNVVRTLASEERATRGSLHTFMMPIAA